MAASSHPFTAWKAQEDTDHSRYHQIVEDLQDVARANLVFGLHVHVGIKDKQVASVIANQIRYFLPHLLALTCSSPFWKGRNTGLKGYRCQVFKRFHAGIPDEFESVEQLQNFINQLVPTNCELVSDMGEALGTIPYLERNLKNAHEGSSAQRQLEVCEQSGGKLEMLVDWLIEETMRGI